MIKIGNATLYNQDCLDFLKGIENKSIDLCLIDPPYEIETTGGANKKPIANMKSKYFLEFSKFSKGFSEDVLDELCRVLKKINIYIFCSKKQVPKLLNYFIEKDCLFEILTWHKKNPPPLCGDSYLPDTEYILFFKEKGVKLLGTYHSKSKYYISNKNNTDKKKYKHPTIKPIPLLKNFIINSSKESDVVLDCFGGSFSTAVASLRLNRKFIGCEIDKTYFDIGVERLKDETFNLFNNIC